MGITIFRGRNIVIGVAYPNGLPQKKITKVII
jgi:hypothetical protein